MQARMIGQSPAYLEMLRLIERIARWDATVLIEGETGTGKELTSRAIHYSSARRDHPFIPVNCGAIPDGLVENELFGHTEGAYTDARHDQSGLVARGTHGTLFLDEVDALTPRAQVALLRFLQDQRYRPLGGRDVRLADVRVIAASNEDLEALARQGRFRLDLLFRLKIMYLRVPPLRQRAGDAVLLAENAVRLCAERFGDGEKRLDAETLAWLESYDWPGNIRELENLICREYLLTDGAFIHVAPPAAVHGRTAPAEGEALDFRAAKRRAIDEFEREYITSVLVATSGNVTRAAMRVGKERRAFGKLLKKHRIDRSRYAV